MTALTFEDPVDIVYNALNAYTWTTDYTAYGIRANIAATDNGDGQYPASFGTICYRAAGSNGAIGGKIVRVKHVRGGNGMFISRFCLNTSSRGNGNVVHSCFNKYAGGIGRLCTFAFSRPCRCVAGASSSGTTIL